MKINIVGKLSGFGALGVVLLVLAFSFETMGNSDFATIPTSIAVVIFGIIIFGAIFKIAKSLPKIF